MNIKSLIKNKFIIAIPIALLLFGCLYKFNEFRNGNKEQTEDTNEGENKQDIKYYLKALIICYLLGIVFVILIRKGYDYYINGTKSNNSSKDSLESLNKIDLLNNEELKPKEETSFNKEDAIINRENELKNDIEELNFDIDTSNLESVDIPIGDLTPPENPSPIPESKPQPLRVPVYKNDEKTKVNKSVVGDISLKKKKQMLLEKRKKLVALKNQQKKKKIEQFQTGTPNF